MNAFFVLNITKSLSRKKEKKEMSKIHRYFPITILVTKFQS